MDQPDPDKPKDDQDEQPPQPPGSQKFTLPAVTLADNSPEDENAPACPAGNKMAEAVDAQEELLAEFQRVAEELQKLIGDLEGSTFVKRLKAMSRRELVLAHDVNDSTLAGFGMNQAMLKDATMDRMKLLVERQKAHGITLQHIQDDLEAYSNRVQDGKYKTVLAEMRDIEVVKQVCLVADRMVANEPGTSIAHSEFLADTLDRWAEQLVGPG
jgi:DNA-binding transcriptional MerR regulator